MSTPTTRKGRRKLGLFAVLTAALGLFLALGVSNAAATVNCTFDLFNGQVQIIVSDDSPPNAANTNNTVTVQVGGSSTIVVNGANCVDPVTFTVASTLNTQQINVAPANNGADGHDTLVINQQSGRFEPGAATLGFSDFFAPSLNEIEWYVNLGLGSNTLQIDDTNAASAITIGSDGGIFGVDTVWDGAPLNGVNGPYPLCFPPEGPIAGDLMINLNAFPADDDADVFAPESGHAVLNGHCATTGIDAVIVNLNGGDNFLTGKGGDGTGAPTSVPLVITAGAGADDITGGLGSDIISPGTGAAFVNGNGPFESLVCRIQNDVLATWEFDPFCSLGDVIDLSALEGPINATLQNDGTLTGTGIPGTTILGVEHVIGTQGDDTINGNALANYLGGAGGNDTINGGPGNDWVDGDNVAGLAANPGTPGNDTLAGGLGVDTVTGGPGDDTIDENAPLDASGAPTYGPLGNGPDQISGGPGTDTVTYSARTNTIVVYLGLISTFNDGADTNNDGLSNEGDDIFFDTENVETGSGDDLISANFVNNRANNVFTDNGGNDCLEGGPGNDTFNQGSAPQGADVMIGNTGSDTSNYGNRSGAVQVVLDGVANDGDIETNEGDNVGGFSVSCRPGTVLANPPLSFFDDGVSLIIPNPVLLDAPIAGPAPQLSFFFCIFGSPFNPIFRAPQGGVPVQNADLCPGEQIGGDQAPLQNVDVENVNGGSGNDILVGDRVGNVLNGNGGDDTLNGGAGADALNGGEGNDLLRGGAGNDAIDGGGGTNRVDYASAGAGGVGVNVNLITGTATGEGNDTLRNIQHVNGSSFRDVIVGDANNNILNGGGGDDAISGNAGDDNINGGGGADQLSGQTGNDRIAGANGNDAIQGGPGNDLLKGGQGKDTILGQRGNDRLFGNAQPDFLNGGSGSDVCKPGSPGLARGDVVVNCER